MIVTVCGLGPARRLGSGFGFWVLESCDHLTVSKLSPCPSPFAVPLKIQ